MRLMRYLIDTNYPSFWELQIHIAEAIQYEYVNKLEMSPVDTAYTGLILLLGFKIVHWGWVFSSNLLGERYERAPVSLVHFFSQTATSETLLTVRLVRPS